MLSVRDLPLEPVVLPSHDGAQFMLQLGASVYEVERKLIVRTLAYAGGNKKRASDILGMSRRNLYNRLNGYAAHDQNGHLNGHVYRNGRNGGS
jgi:DNA-binding NtrC family response regulator